MTAAPANPWSGRMPQVQTQHTMPLEEFSSLVATVSDVLNGRVCCPEHGARIAITVAAACLLKLHGDKLDTLDRELRNACNWAMNNFRDGTFRPDAKQMEE